MVQFCILLSALLTVDLIRGDVVVVANRSSDPVTFTATVAGGGTRSWTLASRDLVTIPIRGEASITCSSATPAEYKVDANEAYYFVRATDAPLALRQIDLGGDAITRKGRDLGLAKDADKPFVIPVKILVDDDERAAQRAWESRLRKRIEAASEIFTRLFQVRFEVVNVSTWRTDSEMNAFEDAYREFEQSVNHHPARLAIGFSSQFHFLDADNPTSQRLPLHPHMLLGERSNQHTEAERLESLVHALGHYLGAVHSPEPDSVMRLMQGDGQSRARGFRIQFDPISAMSIYLLAEEIRFRSITDFAQISPGTNLRLGQLYRVVNTVLPDDPVASFFLTPRRPDGSPPPSPRPEPKPPGVGDGNSRQEALARVVLGKIVEEARVNARSSRGGTPAAKARKPLSGDELTVHYVRQAAQAAGAVGVESAPRAFLLAIGIGLDDSDILRKNPVVRDLCRTLESEQERAERLAVLGQPTLLGRRDLCQHFAVSLFLTAAFGEDVAESAGIAKEMLDARSGSGFSFVDLAADYAGILLAKNLLASDMTLRDTSMTFNVPAYIPAIDELPEGLDWPTFESRFGSVADQRFLQMRALILARISKLPAFKRSAG